MGKFANILNTKKFVVTCEVNPPKGIDLDSLYEKVEMLRGLIDAFNITDSAGSRMTMAPIGIAHLLLDMGVESILQITCRDRNRLALQSELLAAYALGTTNIICMSGDPPSGGDNPNAKAVFDLDAVSLLRTTTSLQAGIDSAGNDLTGAPSFCMGAVVNPGARDLDKEFRRMEEKVQAGASFFQTQAVYEPNLFEDFMNVAEKFNVPILAGLIVLKSAKMARNLNANLPGVFVPSNIIDELDNAESSADASVEIMTQIIRDVRQMCAGIHIMAIGWEAKIPQILRGVGLASQG